MPFQRSTCSVKTVQLATILLALIFRGSRVLVCRHVQTQEVRAEEPAAPASSSGGAAQTEGSPGWMSGFKLPWQQTQNGSDKQVTSRSLLPKSFALQRPDTVAVPN